MKRVTSAYIVASEFCEEDFKSNPYIKQMKRAQRKERVVDVFPSLKEAQDEAEVRAKVYPGIAYAVFEATAEYKSVPGPVIKTEKHPC